MKLVCSPTAKMLPDKSDSILPVLLYGRSDTEHSASAGAAAMEELIRSKLRPSQRAIDFLSLALSVITADLSVLRAKSPDGWTREIDLSVDVVDPDFWNSQSEHIESMLQFVTTDIWNLNFRGGGYSLKEADGESETPEETSVALLSGGADSLVGVLDLTAGGNKPFVVSQTVHGDGEKQSSFASQIGGGLRHLQLNHNSKFSGEGDRDQRARSIIFLAYGILAATSTRQYHEGATIPLYVCENGFISINPPLTEARVGSLSTRTTHPVYLAKFQQLLDAADIRVRVENPYQLKTKGEMFAECSNQDELRKLAHVSTSCGRFRTFGLEHCGRCIPCLIRRAAFYRWGYQDETIYTHSDLSLKNSDHADYDDVRSSLMACATVDDEGIDRLIGATLSTNLITDTEPIRETVARGVDELRTLFGSFGLI